MTKNVLDWLEASAARAPDEAAFEDEKDSVSFAQLLVRAKEVGSYLAARVKPQTPVMLLMEKAPQTIAAMLGAVYAGCFYCPVDRAAPRQRLQMILEKLAPSFVISDQKSLHLAKELGLPHCVAEEIPFKTDDALLLRRRREHIDADILYVLFTSGSTGTPKGVAIAHRSVIDFIEWACGALRLPKGARLGSQAPLYFDNSVFDIFVSLKTESCLCFLPKADFSFPGTLLRDLCRLKIDTIFWVPSVLTSIANSGALAHEMPSLRRVFFCGEAMPCRTLNAWKRALPDARFVNMYGPTEITDVCAWYEVDRAFEDGDALPIGFPCDNTRILLLEGEICVGGTCLAAGYYNDPEKTAAVFIQNPLRPQITERLYKTGDLGAYNERGELMFLGRRDSQIKRHGYRIELGEIECALCAAQGVLEGCCFYEAEAEKIICVYAGRIEEKPLRAQLKESLPKYMLPDELSRRDALPLSPGGKLDRMRIRGEYEHSIR